MFISRGLLGTSLVRARDRPGGNVTKPRSRDGGMDMMNLASTKQYLHSSRMVQNLLSVLGLIIGMDLILIGHVPPMLGIAASLVRLFDVPPAMHGASIAFVSLSLAYATAKRYQAMAACLLVVGVGIYMLIATAALFAAHVPVMFACGTAAGASTWQVFVVMWGGNAHVDGGAHHDPRLGRVGGHGGPDCVGGIEGQ